MSYRLSVRDPLPDSVRACAREQLWGAVRQLEGEGDAPATAIHEARKSLKKTRALLRLVRPALGKRTYRAENGALRDAAAQLSATRDADVLVATVDALAQHAAGRLPASDFAAVRAALVAEAAAHHAPSEGESSLAAVAASVALELRAAHARVEQWPLDGAGWETVVAGISVAYARGRAERELAEAHPSVVHLHDWRKRVKDLWYHHRLLKPVWPDVVKAWGEEAHILSEQLGDDHDLAVLRERLEQGLDAPLELAPLLALVEQRRGELQAQARLVAARLYVEKPKAFERRVGGWVAAAVAEANAAADGANGASS
ncbi:CHAD domain-containing protein [Conexibacter sp. JD483]|uniref:CHAD domain-containing protein n=1 Tax=unclassified Conexibacter TaxID=2627773 RepID=UPI002727EF14|nr:MULTISPECIES: CHAD domain-containing protein [unclassified Conexibacter]MDO8188674.1 CHAD domain-containing protein [Conexibacter sp. CPCC 205706]MDO8199353.1 CHAD domain-containing protein [Conexibacter sp. CPCC 205762]MDR9370847.1 CHAD domain-containing protein [Conexibacter sp. JD483]